MELDNNSNNPSTVSFGVGGVGVGLYPDFSMIETMNEIAETVHPNPQNQAIYEKIYPIFNKLYEVLEPVYEEMANV